MAAATELVVKESTEVGSRIDDLLAAGPATVTDGDKFLNDGKTVLLVKNTYVSTATTLTFDAAGLDNFGQYADAAYEITGTATSGSYWVLGPFSTRHFNDDDGMCTVTCSQVTGITMLPIKIGATIG
jgi:hypothetical protein